MWDICLLNAGDTQMWYSEVSLSMDCGGCCTLLQLFTFFLLNCLFIYLAVLSLSCSLRKLLLQLMGPSFLTRYWTQSSALGAQSLSHWPAWKSCQFSFDGCQPRGPLWRKPRYLMEHWWVWGFDPGRWETAKPTRGSFQGKVRMWDEVAPQVAAWSNESQTTDPAGAFVLVPAPCYLFGWLGGSPSCPHLGLSFLTSRASSSLFQFFQWMTVQHYIHKNSGEISHVEMQMRVYSVSGCLAV